MSHRKKNYKLAKYKTCEMYAIEVARMESQVAKNSSSVRDLMVTCALKHHVVLSVLASAPFQE